MPDYSQGKIYKIEPIVEHKEHEIYIGSTTQNIYVLDCLIVEFITTGGNQIYIVKLCALNFSINMVLIIV